MPLASRVVRETRVAVRRGRKLSLPFASESRRYGRSLRAVRPFVDGMPRGGVVPGASIEAPTRKRRGRKIVVGERRVWFAFFAPAWVVGENGILFPSRAVVDFRKIFRKIGSTSCCKTHVLPPEAFHATTSGEAAGTARHSLPRRRDGTHASVNESKDVRRREARAAHRRR